MGRRSRAYRNGFSLIELLVTVLILAVLMAIALPLYLSATAESEKRTCRTNMQTIANAVEALRVYSGQMYEPIPTPVSAMLQDLHVEPICPGDGHYYVDLSHPPFTVHCTIEFHEIPDGPGGPGYTPGVDGE